MVKEWSRSGQGVVREWSGSGQGVVRGGGKGVGFWLVLGEVSGVMNSTYFCNF